MAGSRSGGTSRGGGANRGLQARLEVQEERPVYRRRDPNAIAGRLESLSAAWKLPFGTDSSILPSAAGLVPETIPTLCGLGPHGRDLFSPHEAVHRGELLQCTLLLALYLNEFLTEGRP